MKKELGKILIDIAKLVIGGVILAGLMRQDIEPVLLFTVGGISAMLRRRLEINHTFIGLFPAILQPESAYIPRYAHAFRLHLAKNSSNKFV
ncbi:MAG: hypothetical protein LBJ60_00615 [Tannerellaceae bacterium]|jgi:hypothetical protein|nr:hypothetical protein [Tannerellaceae bacterium]